MSSSDFEQLNRDIAVIDDELSTLTARTQALRERRRNLLSQYTITYSADGKPFWFDAKTGTIAPCTVRGY